MQREKESKKMYASDGLAGHREEIRKRVVGVADIVVRHHEEGRVHPPASPALPLGGARIAPEGLGQIWSRTPQNWRQ